MVTSDQPPPMSTRPKAPPPVMRNGLYVPPPAMSEASPWERVAKQVAIYAVEQIASPGRCINGQWGSCSIWYDDQRRIYNVAYLASIIAQQRMADTATLNEPLDVLDQTPDIALSVLAQIERNRPLPANHAAAIIDTAALGVVLTVRQPFNNEPQRPRPPGPMRVTR